jgi:hypothetical protein
MQEQEKQEYYFLKFGKYIVTIQDLSIIPYYDLMKYSSSTNNFKILLIEDIKGNSYESINFLLYHGRFFDRDIYEIHYTESKNIKLNDIINDLNSFQIYFYDKNDALFSNFFKEQQHKLFESGYTNFCRFNISPSYSFEFLVNNNKIIGTVKMYINNKIYSEIMFDRIITDNIVVYNLYNNYEEIEEKIEIKKEEFMIKMKDINIFSYLDY